MLTLSSSSRRRGGTDREIPEDHLRDDTTRTLVRGTRPVPTAVEHCPTATSTPDLDFYQVSVAVEPAYFFLQDNFLELCNLYTRPGLLPSIRSSGACLLLPPRQQLPEALQPTSSSKTTTSWSSATSTPYLDFYQVSVAVEPAYFFLQDNNFLELCNLLLPRRQQLPGALQPLHQTWTSTKYP